jgi:hypothetical protein
MAAPFRAAELAPAKPELCALHGNIQSVLWGASTTGGRTLHRPCVCVPHYGVTGSLYRKLPICATLRRQPWHGHVTRRITWQPVYRQPEISSASKHLSVFCSLPLTKDLLVDLDGSGKGLPAYLRRGEPGIAPNYAVGIVLQKDLPREETMRR